MFSHFIFYLSISVDFIFNSFSHLFTLCRAYRFLLSVCYLSSSFRSVNTKAKQTRDCAGGNMATPTERHGGLQRDRKSIPGSRYGSGSHRDGDSAPFRISGWNSFEYRSKERVRQRLSPLELTGAITSVSWFFSVIPG
jgi:hypothetical protein